MTFLTPQRTWIMTPGRLCWLPPQIQHGFVSQTSVSGVSLKVSGQECHGLPDHPKILHPDPFFELALGRLVERPHDFSGLWQVLSQAIIEAPPDRLVLPAPFSPRLVRLAQALMLDPADPRNLPEWAKEVGLSPRTLVRRLKAETGLSFAVWRQRLRLMHATAAMQSGGSATNAALDSGFGTASAFSAAFRKHMGMAPTVYLRAK